MQLVFFSLIPVGILLLILSVRLVSKSFSGNIILDLPYLKKSSEFVLEKEGTYAIWHKGQYFRRAPLDKFRPEITSLATGEKVPLVSSLFRPNINNGRMARMELFRFTAPAGKYFLELGDGSSITKIENGLIRLIPARMADPDKYFIQVRDSQPRLLAFLGIILISLAGLCIIFGLVFGILADQIFTK